MFNKILILSAIVALTSLSGCKQITSMGRDKPLTPYQICAELKRKIIFYSNDPNHATEWNSPRRKAILFQDYKKYNCAEILSE